jgi:hypothetical protein
VISASLAIPRIGPEIGPGLGAIAATPQGLLLAHSGLSRPAAREGRDNSLNVGMISPLIQLGAVTLVIGNAVLRKDEQPQHLAEDYKNRLEAD